MNKKFGGNDAVRRYEQSPRFASSIGESGINSELKKRRRQYYKTLRLSPFCFMNKFVLELLPGAHRFYSLFDVRRSRRIR